MALPQGAGVEAAQVARGALLGQTTVGFPVSPLTPSTFLLVGLAQVNLADHQRFSLRVTERTEVQWTRTGTRRSDLGIDVRDDGACVLGIDEHIAASPWAEMAPPPPPIDSTDAHHSARPSRISISASASAARGSSRTCRRQ